MSGTALDHPMIRQYLRELDAALGVLRPEQARELREQITAHLDDELPPGAAEAEVSGALQRLGSPSEVAAAAVSGQAGRPQAVGPQPEPTTADVSRWLRNAIRRRTWRFWTILGAVVVAAGVVAGFIVNMETAPPLAYSGESGWWYPVDGQRQVSTTADGATQTTVPVRWHQRQGFFVQLVNTSGWTQTVLGPSSDSAQGLASATGQLAVSVPYNPRDYWPGDPRTVRYSLPVSIPPGQSRYLRLMWTSNVCLEKGGSEGTDQLDLRVRVGWFTRTEVVWLGQGWYVAGTARSTC
jgi:hypothetical protein